MPRKARSTCSTASSSRSFSIPVASRSGLLELNLKSPAQLGRGLASEGHRGEGADLALTLPDQVDHAGDQAGRLAGSGGGFDQNVPVELAGRSGLARPGPGRLVRRRSRLAGAFFRLAMLASSAKGFSIGFDGALSLRSLAAATRQHRHKCFDNHSICNPFPSCSSPGTRRLRRSGRQLREYFAPVFELLGGEFDPFAAGLLAGKKVAEALDLAARKLAGAGRAARSSPAGRARAERLAPPRMAAAPACISRCRRSCSPRWRIRLGLGPAT